MLGAIVGDVIGSDYEHAPTKRTDFELFSANSRFTDDTVLSVAVAQWILEGGSLASLFHQYVDRYPQAGYGESFYGWSFRRERAPYNSWGNGSAMRVSPVGYARDTLDETLALAEQTSAVTHDHPEGIRGAQAVAGCVYLARTGGTKEDILSFAGAQLGYDVSRTLAEIRPDYTFDVSCQGSVPESIIALLESIDYEWAVRGAVSLGGDSDTMACMAGAIAEPLYGGVPAPLADEALDRLDDPLYEVVQAFYDRFEIGTWPE
jgi:ADP-ribosylglycohydrolase